MTTGSIFPVPNDLPRPSVSSRRQASLLGSALGDAVGELAQTSLRRFKVAGLDALVAGEEVLSWTDDTAMGLALAECLVSRGEVEEAFLGDRFRLAWEREPWRGYAGGPPTIFALVTKDGIGYVEAAKRVNTALYGEAGSCGNGAAMRAAPLGLFYPPGKALEEAARSQSILTHCHPAGVEGAYLQALAVALALAGDPAASFDAPAFARALLAEARTSELRGKLETVLGLLDAGAEDARAAEVLGRDVLVQESWPFALWSFLAHPDSFRECLACAATNGGDADTVAAMACAISGARLGLEGLPFEWLAKLESRARIAELALLLDRRASGEDLSEDIEAACEIKRWELEVFGYDSYKHCHPDLPSFSLDLPGGYLDRHVGHLAGEPEPDWASLAAVEVETPEDGNGAADLEPARHAEIMDALDAMRDAMETRAAWFHDNGEEVLGPRWLALGASQGLVAFSERLSPRLGTELLVAQYLVWPNLQRPGPSMLFFIEGADRIDVDLSGFSFEELVAATRGHSGPAASWREAGISGMAAWCLNRVYWGPALSKAHWHCTASLPRPLVLEALGDRVEAARILED